jgi:hypothetical protein
LNFKTVHEYLAWMANIEKTPALLEALSSLDIDNPQAWLEVISSVGWVTHAEAVRNLIREWTFSANNWINWVGQTMQWRLSEFTRFDIQTSLAKDLAAWSWLQKSKQNLIDIVRGKGVGAFRDSAWRVRTLPRYAEMITRTETARAFNTATVNRWLDLWITKFLVHERADACVICQPHRWKIYDVNDWNALFPPYHPNCRWFLTPVLPD